MPEASIDVAIIGAGPAGMAAALYAKRKALSVRIFDTLAAGGQAADAIFIENYPGVQKKKGAELMQDMQLHLASFGVEVEEAAEVTRIKKSGKEFELEINEGEEKLLAKAVILCTGSEHRKLGAKGEEEFEGKGVFYCATCDGPAFKGKTVAVLGAGNSGANAAMFFSGICKKVFLLDSCENYCFDPIYEKHLSKAGVEVLLGKKTLEISGKERVETIKFKDIISGKEETLQVNGVFVYAGMQPRNILAKGLGLLLDAKGCVAVNARKESSLKGIFAAGDIAGEISQIVIAAGSGAIAATAAFDFIKGLQ